MFPCCSSFLHKRENIKSIISPETAFCLINRTPAGIKLR